MTRRASASLGLMNWSVGLIVLFICLYSASRAAPELGGTSGGPERGSATLWGLNSSLVPFGHGSFVNRYSCPRYWLHCPVRRFTSHSSTCHEPKHGGLCTPHFLCSYMTSVHNLIQSLRVWRLRSYSRRWAGNSFNAGCWAWCIRNASRLLLCERW